MLIALVHQYLRSNVSEKIVQPVFKRRLARNSWTFMKIHQGSIIWWLFFRRKELKESWLT